MGVAAWLIANPASWQTEVIYGSETNEPTPQAATNADGTMCTVTLTQQVCVSIPVRYGVTMSTCDPTISCADSCVGCGCC